MSLRRTTIVGLLVLAAIAVALFVWPRIAGQTRATTAKGPAAVPVSTAKVAVKNVPVRLSAVGNVEPYTSVAVKARVDGQIVSVHFKEGDRVRKGDVLFEIDPRPFQAALAQAQANLAKDQAQLDRAKTQDARNLDLLKQNFISKDAYEQFKTNVETAAATVRGDQAAVDNAKLQLDYCTIRSTLDGYAGRILIQEGNLVKANDTNPLVTINQIVPVFTTFSVPEQNLPEIREHQAKGDLVVQTTLPSGTHPPITGRLSFIDNSADTTTGTIRLKAEFANKDTALWPGQFVNVVLTLYEQDNAVVTPSTAIQNGPNGQYVFVVKPDHTVELRNIKIDRAVGDDTVIASGLQPGETVVTAGQLRLAPGSRVTVDGAKAA
ncbi:MAG TPA: efflux RND transporter periplasmic adaptor subunit [Casimicrobiaceae bacterium]|jgi:multidrug efflux system membrane fusion protein|nr:efflux RND transporter periplasmic adaptor subunit [Casimicrobiaceae bacterium]